MDVTRPTFNDADDFLVGTVEKSGPINCLLFSKTKLTTSFNYLFFVHLLTNKITKHTTYFISIVYILNYFATDAFGLIQN